MTMTKNQKLLFLVAGIAAAASLVAALTTGFFGFLAPRGKTSAASQDANVAGQAGKVEIRQTIEPGVNPADPFLIHMFRPEAGQVVYERFGFVNSDITPNRTYDAFSKLLARLPGATYDRNAFSIFRVKDEARVEPGSALTVTAGANPGVLVIPKEAIASLGGEHQAFTFYLSKVGERKR